MKSWYFSHDSLGHRARAKVPLDNNDNHLTALISPKSSGRRQGIRHPRGLLATRCCTFASGSWKVMCGFQTRLQQEATKVLQFGGKQTHLNARYPDQTSISIAILLSNLKGCCPEVLPAAKLEPAAVSRIRDTIVSESWERHASVDCPMI